jgi:D-tyrosyl-tRNA(Tyr) deacylase
MIAVVQRCSHGEVRVEGETVGSLGRSGGLVVLVGVETGDSIEHARKLGEKIAKLRVFEDDEGKMNRSVQDVGGSVLLISQFTLAGDCAGGNRPSFTRAARPEAAEPLFDAVVAAVRATGLEVATGRFRTEMKVELLNDGPVTLILRVP